MQVIHDAKKNEFRVELGAYHAVLLYARHKDVLDFYHIYVPDPFRGGAIAGKILIEAFEYAETEGCQVAATCPFIAEVFLTRFPQYQKIVCPGKFPFAGGQAV